MLEWWWLGVVGTTKEKPERGRQGPGIDQLTAINSTVAMLVRRASAGGGEVAPWGWKVGSCLAHSYGGGEVSWQIQKRSCLAQERMGKPGVPGFERRVLAFLCSFTVIECLDFSLQAN